MSALEDTVAVRAASLVEIPVIAAMQAACFAGQAADLPAERKAESSRSIQLQPISGDSARDESAWGESALASLLAGPGCFALIALRDGQPAGFALGRQAADECEVLSLGVLPAQRRLGVGRALLAALCGQAGSAGARRIYLEVAADNYAGRALYEALGFESSAWRKNYYRRPGQAAIDAVVLVRNLA